MRDAVAQSKLIRAMGPRNATRRWLGIEVSGYVLVCLFLVTVAWANDHISGPVVVGAWAVGGSLLTLALRAIYRRGHLR
jgi:hypothetical protein